MSESDSDSSASSIDTDPDMPGLIDGPDPTDDVSLEVDGPEVAGWVYEQVGEDAAYLTMWILPWLHSDDLPAVLDALWEYPHLMAT